MVLDTLIKPPQRQSDSVKLTNSMASLTSMLVFFLLTWTPLSLARQNDTKPINKLYKDGQNQVAFPRPTYPLDYTYYDESCPDAEAIVRSRVKYFFDDDKENAPALLKLLFQDCFVNGCDGSVLLHSSHSQQNQRAIDIINNIKSFLEYSCPNTVSCSDIIALAARDAVFLTEGPYFPIPTGRLDGFYGDTEEEVNETLPKGKWNVSQLLKSFKSKGLDVMDLVALSGAHTIGKAHCPSVLSSLCPIDGHVSPKFVKKLLKKCPSPESKNTVDLDRESPDEFDNEYYKEIMKGNGVLRSDRDLFNDARTTEIVRMFRESERSFSMQFSASAIKMSQIGFLTGSYGEIRLNCSIPNDPYYEVNDQTHGRNII